METYLIYLLKSSVALAIFYLFYFLVLRDETYYTSNRFYLILGLIMAALLPALPISYTITAAVTDVSKLVVMANKSVGGTIPLATESSENVSVFYDPLFVFAFIYGFGAGIFLLRLTLQTIMVMMKLRHGKRRLISDITVIDLNREIMPFSFFNNVIINTKAYSKEELSNIIAHEKVHVQERHWIDLLIIELMTVVFWINPIVWLYERSIKQNHEYLADRGVLLAGCHSGQYQALLINQLMGVKILGLTNSLNNSLNKKRMEMMKKDKSKSRIKLLLVLPVVTVLIFAFAEKKVAQIENNNQPIVTQNLSDQVMITMKGTIKTEEGIPLEGAHIILKNTNKGTVSDNNGIFEIEIPIDGVLVVSYIGYETISVTDALPGENERSIHVKMKKGIYNFILPDMTGFMFDKGLPPPPPAKRRNEREVINIVEKMAYMPSISYIIRRDVLSVMEKTQDRGKVLVGFTLNSNGEITNPYISKSSNSKFLDTSALRIIADLKGWEPGVQRGKKVPVDGTLLVSFN